MKRFLILLSVLLLLPLCAGAVAVVPDGVTAVEAEAFANTGIDALIIPASVEIVGPNVLNGCDASYIFLKGDNTVLASGAANGVPFVFAPEGTLPGSMVGYYPSEQLVVSGGLYYAVSDTAIPLCAREPSSLSGTVTIPKVLNGAPVTALDVLYLGNTGVTSLRVPEYLPLPSSGCTSYQTIFATAPAPGAYTATAGEAITWTTSVEGAYGDVTYSWTFDFNGQESFLVTTEPSAVFTPPAAGTCSASVRVEDSLLDFVIASSLSSVTVESAPDEPVYRALLIGNTYPGSNPLPGPDNDVAAMATMLRTMVRTPYAITRHNNMTASDIQWAIANAFADAKANDVSLFYFSGHGTDAGALVGTNNTYLSVYSLRTALQKIPGTKIVLLDCCYSGQSIGKSATAKTSSPASFNRAVVSAFASFSRSAENLADSGYVVITACRGDQESLSLTGDLERYWGAFTYGICYGSGYDEWEQVSLPNLPADADGNGAITMQEAYRGALERISFLRNLLEITQEVQYYGDPAFVLWRR